MPELVLIGNESVLALSSVRDCNHIV